MPLDKQGRVISATQPPRRATSALPLRPVLAPPPLIIPILTEAALGRKFTEIPAIDAGRAAPTRVNPPWESVCPLPLRRADEFTEIADLSAALASEAVASIAAPPRGMLAQQKNSTAASSYLYIHIHICIYYQYMMHSLSMMPSTEFLSNSFLVVVLDVSKKPAYMNCRK